MNWGIGETSATSASTGLSPTSRATMLANVMAVWMRPNAVEIMVTGRTADSCWAWRSRS